MWILETQFLLTSDWKQPSMGIGRLHAEDEKTLKSLIPHEIHRLYAGVRMKNTKTGETKNVIL